MACPCLREGRARYCHAAPVRKLILDGPGATDGGRCASPRYLTCELASKDGPQYERCPHLEEIRVQYCGVSPIPKLVPFSDSQLSSCTSDNYRYCDSYLHLAQPHATKAPANLLFTPNHFWLDAEESGLCHIGIDGFVADIAGNVDGVTFVTARGTHCPTLTLTIHGVEWPMSFPNPVMIQKVISFCLPRPGLMFAGVVVKDPRAGQRRGERRAKRGRDSSQYAKGRFVQATLQLAEVSVGDVGPFRKLAQRKLGSQTLRAQQRAKRCQLGPGR